MELFAWTMFFALFFTIAFMFWAIEKDQEECLFMANLPFDDFDRPKWWVTDKNNSLIKKFLWKSAADAYVHCTPNAKKLGLKVVPAPHPQDEP